MTQGPATIPAALRAAAENFADDPAIVAEGDAPVAERTMTFAELDRRADEVAAALIGAGIEAGDRVGLWAPNSELWVVASFGVYRAGAVLVPISTRYRGPEAGDILRRSKASALIAANDFLRPTPAEMLAAEDGLDDLVQRIALSGAGAEGWTTFAEFIAGGRSITAEQIEERARAIGPDDLSDLIFTSGTTGRPKGAMLRHAASVETYRQWAEHVGLRAGDHYLLVYPFFHTSGLKSGVLACVLQGAAIHPHAVFDVAAMMARVPVEGITVLPGPPTVFQSILDHPDRSSFDLSSVRASITGAAVVPVEVIRRMREELHIPDVVTGYGLTETHGTVSMNRFTDTPEQVALTIGKPLAGLEVRVVDDEGRELPTGEAGEFWVRGFNVMSGYFDDDTGTAEAIVTADDGTAGWLRTGDVGFLDDDGRLHITDRKKDMFIVGGFNAYPAEIESRMLEHPDILQVAVIGVPDERMGEVGLAFVVLRDGGELRAETVAEQLTPWCRERMANFKVPREFRVEASLPLNATGKVAKAELKSRI